MAWYLPVRQPVLWEEMRRRLRGARGYWVLLGFGMTLILILGFLTVITLTGNGPIDLSRGPKVWPEFGKTLWTWFLIAQLGLLVLISPGITAGAISTEREKGTLEAIFLTPLSTLTLAVGKFFGAIGQLLVVVLSGLPVIATVFSFGGVSPLEIALGYLVILGTGLLCAALGFLASCLFARTVSATVWAYGFMLFALAGLPLLFLFLSLIDPFFSTSVAESLLMPNPAICYAIYAGDQPLEVWKPLLSMLVTTIVVLIGCGIALYRLRGSSSLSPHRVSLAVARLNSRAAAK